MICLRKAIKWGFFADAAGNTTYTNSKFRKYTGLAEGASCNVFSDAVVHPEDYESGITAFKRSLETQSQFEVKRRLKSAKGTYQQFLTRATPIVHGNKVVGYYGVCLEKFD